MEYAISIKISQLLVVTWQWAVATASNSCICAAIKCIHMARQPCSHGAVGDLTALLRRPYGCPYGAHATTLNHDALYSAVAQLVECRTRNRESPGSNPRCYRFEVWAFSFTSRHLSRLSCINEYLAIDSGGNVSE